MPGSTQAPRGQPADQSVRIAGGAAQGWPGAWGRRRQAAQHGRRDPSHERVGIAQRIAQRRNGLGGMRRLVDQPAQFVGRPVRSAGSPACITAIKPATVAPVVRGMILSIAGRISKLHPGFSMSQ